MSGEGAALGRRLREHDVTAAPAALNIIESHTRRADAADLLREVSAGPGGAEQTAHVIGITGPPGAGKSTLISALLTIWRRHRRSVAVLAVDPSSRRSGGALLGDRARIEFDAADLGVFVRSTAAAGRLGGLAPPTRAAAHALAAAFDIVVIETVGVGQSETDVAEVADTVAVVVQPGAGDVLQYIKAGIMETPDVLVVTKADLGAIAGRSQHDLHAALRSSGARNTSVLTVSSVPPIHGTAELVDVLDTHRAGLDIEARRLAVRRSWALAEFHAEHGDRGLRAAGGRRETVKWLAQQEPSLNVAALVAALEQRAS